MSCAVAIAPLVAALSVAPLALGDQLVLHVGILEQASPVGVSHRFDPDFDAVGFGLPVQLLRRGLGGAGFGGLAENGAGCKQCLKGN